MKKFLLIVLTALTLSASAQKGIYYWVRIQSLSSDKIHNAKISGFQGMRLMVPWDFIQTSENDYSLTAVKAAVARCADSAMEVELELWVGPDAPINNPTNWLRNLGVDTFNTTGGLSNNASGPYPDYYDSIYKVKYLKIHKALADTLYNIPTYQKAYVKSIFVCNGSTGDGQPKHGLPYNHAFDIYNDADLWDAYKKTQWDSVWSYFTKDTGFLKLAFQPEDIATNLLYCYNRFPGCYLKHGSPAHEYPVDGQAYRQLWPPTVYLSEIDAYAKLTTLEQEHLQVIRSALENHMGRLDFMYPYWTDDTSLLMALPERVFLSGFFNKYCRQFFVPNNQITRGFVALADKIDFRDTINYPIGTYGPLYNSTSSYNASIASIEALSIDEYQKQPKRTNAAINARNTTRISNLAAAGLEYHPFGPFYHNDISWDNTPNYSLNITQKKINETSTGVWRVGDTTQSYGRNARVFKKYNNGYNMYFDIGDSLASDLPSDSVKVTLTYYDSGHASWQVIAFASNKCGECYTTTIKNRDTKTFKQAVITIRKFEFGNKMPYGSDIVVKLLKKPNGTVDNFPIEMLEFENLSKL